MSGTIYCTILVARAKTCAGILSPKIRHVTAIKSRFKERRKRLSSALPFYNQLSLTDAVNRRVDKRLVIFFGRAGPLSGRKPLFFARKFAGRRVKVSHFVLFEVKYIHRLWRLTKKRRKKKKRKKCFLWKMRRTEYIFPFRQSCRNDGKFQLFFPKWTACFYFKNCHVSPLFTYMNFRTISTSFIICSIEPMFEINLLETEGFCTPIFRSISKQRKRGIFQASEIKGIAIC